MRGVIEKQWSLTPVKPKKLQILCRPFRDWEFENRPLAKRDIILITIVFRKVLPKHGNREYKYSCA